MLDGYDMQSAIGFKDVLSYILPLPYMLKTDCIKSANFQMTYLSGRPKNKL